MIRNLTAAFLFAFGLFSVKAEAIFFFNSTLGKNLSVGAILENFDTWDDPNCLPVGWAREGLGSHGCSFFGGGAYKISGTPAGNFYAEIDSQDTEDGITTNMTRTYDLAGKTKLKVDVLALECSMCLRISVNGTNHDICNTGTNIERSITVSGSHEVRIRAFVTPPPSGPVYCRMSIDNLRFE